MNMLSFNTHSTDYADWLATEKQKEESYMGKQGNMLLRTVLTTQLDGITNIQNISRN